MRIVTDAAWPPLALPEAPASRRASASCYRALENLRVVPVVIFELAFGDVERKVLCRHLVIGADYGPLEDAPEPFNRLRMDSADNVLTASVVYGTVRKFHAEVLIADIFV